MQRPDHVINSNLHIIEPKYQKFSKIYLLLFLFGFVLLCLFFRLFLISHFVVIHSFSSYLKEFGTNALQMSVKRTAERKAIPVVFFFRVVTDAL